MSAWGSEFEKTWGKCDVCKCRRPLSALMADPFDKGREGTPAASGLIICVDRRWCVGTGLSIPK